jgi:flagellar protein FlgJ
MDELRLDNGRHAALASTQPAIAPASDAAYVEKVRGAAEKFEAFFIAQLLRQMRESTRAMADEDSVFNSRSAQEMLDMADVALADSLAGQRAFGIADVIVRQLLPTAAHPAFKTSPAPAASSD